MEQNVTQLGNNAKKRFTPACVEVVEMRLTDVITASNEVAVKWKNTWTEESFDD